MKIASTEEIISEAQNGRLFVVVDDEEMAAGGVLAIPAQMATPTAINFMATNGRGLICLALTSARAKHLGLELLRQRNRQRDQTAFAVSIEARHGVTTGISAADRARTISVAIDAQCDSQDVVSPGHVFPIVSNDGGVLSRAGTTEACVDISRLAGLNPSAVICQVMGDDGNLTNRTDLIEFAELHHLKIATVRDLIAYRLVHDSIQERHSQRNFESRYGGEWTAISFSNKATGEETLALIHGAIHPGEPTLVRMHQLSVFFDIFGELGDREGLLRNSMRMIAEEGSGLVVMINRPGPRFATDVIELAKKNRNVSDDTSDQQRDYGWGAQVLSSLGVSKMILLTNTPHSLVALEGYGLRVVEHRPINSKHGCKV